MDEIGFDGAMAYIYISSVLPSKDRMPLEGNRSDTEVRILEKYPTIADYVGWAKPHIQEHFQTLKNQDYKHVHHIASHIIEAYNYFLQKHYSDDKV